MKDRKPVSEPKKWAFAGFKGVAETRRSQILDAATRCVSRYGVHMASISRISAMAGMSSGHIYYYFRSKEEIIAAIVARELHGQIGLTDLLRGVRTFSDEVRTRIADALSAQLDPDLAAFKIEVIAEAGRNPLVAQILQRADEAIRESLSRAVGEIRRARGLGTDPESTDAIVETLATLYGGLPLRIIRNPSLTRERVVERASFLIESTLFGRSQVGVIEPTVRKRFSDSA
ncbi:TetR/AcrR family transcriptional regulator [Thauera sp. WH-2]|uniref:TetR/AcrR family transcriptional regulator n=1 Tax=Thauera sp. WH-2 TaxID=3401574 RepID=UPI003AB0C8E2